VAWADRLERVLTPADARGRRPVELADLRRRLGEALDGSGYRLDRLRQLLASGAPPSRGRPSAGTPRLPMATGLPPGPRASRTSAKSKPGPPKR